MFCRVKHCPLLELEDFFVEFTFPFDGFKVFRYSFLGPYLTFLIGSLQSSPCQINVKFVALVGFGLNFSVVYIL